MDRKKVGVAMSGGVDSTVAAALLQDRGFDVHGFFMLLPVPGLEHQKKKVSETAARLSIPLTFVDIRKEFTDTVIRYFLTSYGKGLTPNPCIFCNHHIKFGLFMDRILASGMEKAATGHYARIVEAKDTLCIRRSPDLTKDQSYFLCRLTTGQLERIIFPLAGWSKERTFQYAGELGFEFGGEESQDVCFLPNDLASFLIEHGFREQEGEITDTAGNHLGTHKGMWKYTVGQRRGLGIPDATPWYVTGLDAAENRVIVGKNHMLHRRTLTVRSLKWHRRPALFPWQGLVQLRSRHRPALAKITPLHSGRGSITFRLPQRAVTPGQYAVIYDGDGLIGSGIIE